MENTSKGSCMKAGCFFTKLKQDKTIGGITNNQETNKKYPKPMKVCVTAGCELSTKEGQKKCEKRDGCAFIDGKCVEGEPKMVCKDGKREKSCPPADYLECTWNAEKGKCQDGAPEVPESCGELEKKTCNPNSFGLDCVFDKESQTCIDKPEGPTACSQLVKKTCNPNDFGLVCVFDKESQLCVDDVSEPTAEPTKEPTVEPTVEDTSCGDLDKKNLRNDGHGMRVAKVH